MFCSRSLRSQVRLADVEEVDLTDRRGYLTVSLTLAGREGAVGGKILLRKPEGIRDWYNAIQVRGKAEL